MTVDSNIAGAAKNSIHLLKGFPTHRILDCEVFSKMFNTLREHSNLPSANVPSE
jgi:hypothetical protein